MKEELRKQMKFISVEQAATPAPGFYRIVVDSWWAITPDEQIMVFRGTAPQCNAKEAIARRIHERLYPGWETRQLPVVYLPFNPNEY